MGTPEIVEGALEVVEGALELVEGTLGSVDGALELVEGILGSVEGALDLPDDSPSLHNGDAITLITGWSVTGFAFFDALVNTGVVGFFWAALSSLVGDLMGGRTPFGLDLPRSLDSPSSLEILSSAKIFRGGGPILTTALFSLGRGEAGDLLGCFARSCSSRALDVVASNEQNRHVY